jgi:hypothetical protein
MRFSDDRLDRITEPAELWAPQTYEEWEARERLLVALKVWEAQANQERTLRGRCAWMIFSLAAFQSVGGAALLLGLGRGWLKLDPEFLKILYSALLAEVFGLFFVIARYLFNQPLRYPENLLDESKRTGVNGVRNPNR